MTSDLSAFAITARMTDVVSAAGGATINGRGNSALLQTFGTDGTRQPRICQRSLRLRRY